MTLHHQLIHLAPSSYLISWNEVEQGAWEDPDFLKGFEKQGTAVTVDEGQSKTTTLTLIRATNEDQKSTAATR